jgi:hypothetical protein
MDGWMDGQNRNDDKHNENSKEKYYHNNQHNTVQSQHSTHSPLVTT